MLQIEKITTKKSRENVGGDYLVIELEGSNSPIIAELTKAVFLKNGCVLVTTSGTNPYSEVVDVYGESMKIAGLVRDEQIFRRYVEMKAAPLDRTFWNKIIEEAGKRNPSWDLSALAL
jgi:hypothetical protein